MQPLDVSVFAPKQPFPALLSALMDKDYSESIKSGFECCGLHPLSQERALAKLPAENRDVVSDVQKQLIQQLSSMRYQ